ncbi:MAG: hypothetical protein L3K23_02240 [Thermoplasmata archaeon]|nr:hypothetical protein [Thermoplasmata archaeon]
MALILLGPSAWVRRYRPAIPAWVVDILPTGRTVEGEPIPTPRDVRFGLVARLRLADLRATALELHHDRSQETPVDKLLRIAHEARIDRYAIYWPYGAVRPALDVEIGWLLHSLQRKEIYGESIGLFYESNSEGRQAARERSRTDGRVVFESLERGRRTTYYQSLVAWGAIPIPWSSYEDLIEFLEVFAS